MNKIQSGAILVAIGVAMNVLGRVVPAARGNSNIVFVGIVALWMFASVVVALFGLFRIGVGLMSKEG